MKSKIDLRTERMEGHGPYLVEEYEVNYLFGLNDLCEKFVKSDFIILELGTNDGVSACLFSYFAKTVITVDMKQSMKLEKMLSENDNIVFHNLYFEEFLEIDKDNTYDLIYIDGCHDFCNVDTEINQLRNKVKKGGFLCGHDFNQENPGVKMAVEKNFPNDEIIIFSDSSWLVEIK